MPPLTIWYLWCFQVMLHRIGQPQSQDACILEERSPGWHIVVSRTRDWAFLLITSACKTSTEVRHPPRCFHGMVACAFSACCEPMLMHLYMG